MNGQRVAAWTAAGFGVLVISMVATFNNRMRERYGDGFRNINQEMTAPQPRLQLIDSGSGAPPKDFDTATPFNTDLLPSANAAAWMRFRAEDAGTGTQQRRSPSAIFEANSLDGKHAYRTRSYRLGDEYLMVVSRDYAYAAKIVVVSGRLIQYGFSTGSFSTTFRLPKLPQPVKRIPTRAKVPAKVEGSSIFAVRAPHMGGGNAVVFIAENTPSNRIVRVRDLLESTYADLTMNYAPIGQTPANRVGRVIGVFTIPDPEFADHVKVTIGTDIIEKHSGKIVLKSLVLENSEGRPALRSAEVENFTIGPAKIATRPISLVIGGVTPYSGFLPMLLESNYMLESDFDTKILTDRGVQLPGPVPVNPRATVVTAEPKAVKYGPLGPVTLEVTAIMRTGGKSVEVTVPVFNNDEVKAQLGFEPLRFINAR